MASHTIFLPQPATPAASSVSAGDSASFYIECNSLGVWKEEGKTQVLREEAWVVTPSTPGTHPWSRDGARNPSLSSQPWCLHLSGAGFSGPALPVHHHAEHGCQMGIQKTRGLTPRKLQSEPPRQQLLSEVSVERNQISAKPPFLAGCLRKSKGGAPSCAWGRAGAGEGLVWSSRATRT